MGRTFDYTVAFSRMCLAGGKTVPGERCWKDFLLNQKPLQVNLPDAKSLDGDFTLRNEKSLNGLHRPDKINARFGPRRMRLRQHLDEF